MSSVTTQLDILLNMLVIQVDDHKQKTNKNWQLCLNLHKISWKLFIALNVKDSTLRNKPCIDLKSGDEYLDKTSKAGSIREKDHKLKFIGIKKCLSRSGRCDFRASLELEAQPSSSSPLSYLQ